MNIPSPPTSPFLGQIPINLPTESAQSNSLQMVLLVVGTVLVIVAGVSIANHLTWQKEPALKQKVDNESFH